MSQEPERVTDLLAESDEFRALADRYMAELVEIKPMIRPIGDADGVCPFCGHSVGGGVVYAEIGGETRTLAFGWDCRSCGAWCRAPYESPLGLPEWATMTYGLAEAAA